MTLSGLQQVAVVRSDYQESERFHTEELGFGIIPEIYREEWDSSKPDLESPGGTQLGLYED